MSAVVFRITNSSRGFYWGTSVACRTIFKPFKTEAECAKALMEFIYAVKCDNIVIEQQDVRENASSNAATDYIGGIVRLRSFLPSRERKILSLVDDRLVKKPVVRKVVSKHKPKPKAKPMAKCKPKKGMSKGKKKK